LVCNTWSCAALISLSVSPFRSPLDSHGNMFIVVIIIIIVIIWIHSTVTFNYIPQPENASKLASMYTHLRVLTKVRITNNFFGSRSEISSLFRVAKKKNLKTLIHSTATIPKFSGYTSRCVHISRSIYSVFRLTQHRLPR
jgi:hypothetical protein